MFYCLLLTENNHFFDVMIEIRSNFKFKIEIKTYFAYNKPFAEDVYWKKKKHKNLNAIISKLINFTF